MSVMSPIDNEKFIIYLLELYSAFFLFANPEETD